MVYKKFAKKGGKIFGPYYYESYREGDKVKKIYIGGEKEYREYIKKKNLKSSYFSSKKNVEQPRRFIIGERKDNIKYISILLFGILFLVLLFNIGLYANISGSHDFRFTGFSINENMTQDPDSNLFIYSSFDNETLKEKYDSLSVSLSIKDPAMFGGEAISRNKNKRMDFELSKGNMRLYFDLLNYSEFIEELAIDLNLTKNENKTIETDVNEQINNSQLNTTGVSENLSIINDSMNIDLGLNNETTSIENDSLNNSELSNQETSITQNEPQINVSENQELNNESIGLLNNTGITGAIIRFFSITGKTISKISARVIGTGDTGEAYSNNEIIEESIKTSNIELDVDRIKEKINDIDKDKIAQLSDKAVLSADNFDIKVNDSADSNERPSYKWGYKVKLKDLKFMAKIKATSNRPILKYNDYTLRIDNNILSFSDLIKENYSVRVEIPELGIEISNISLSELNNITEYNISEYNLTKENTTLANITEPNITDINITTNFTINETNISIILSNFTSNITSNITDNTTIPVSNITPEIINETILIEGNITSDSEGEGNIGQGEDSGNQEISTEPVADSPVSEAGNTQESETTPGEPSDETSAETSNTETSTTETAPSETSTETAPSEPSITGNLIKAFLRITGKVTEAIGETIGMTNNLTILEDLEYNYTVNIYIEKDFSDTNHSIGDIIELDPSLIIIEIADAEHLDENRSFISNIYEQVKLLDDNWSEFIPIKDYIRVTFTRELDNKRDITIFAKASNYTNETNSSYCELGVYRENSEDEIAKFYNITSEGFHKVLLNNLSEGENYSIFDIRVLNSSSSEGIFVDYIVDPASVYNISFIFPTPANNTATINTSIIINVSITNASDLNEVKYNWNGTNYTMYNDSLVLMMNMDNRSGLGEAYNNSNGTIIMDISKYGNNGTLYVGAAGTGNYTTGKYGGAYQFIKESSQYINLFNSSDLTNLPNNNYTLAAWVNPGNYIVYSNIVAINNEALVETKNSKWGLLHAGNVIQCSNSSINIGVWTHIVGVRNGSTYSIYINGQYDVGTFTSNTGYGFQNQYFIAKGYSSPTYFFNGTIDEVRIWNYSLSASEVYQLYVSNLQKFNSTQWYLYVNQSKNASTGLDESVYTYFVSAKDSLGNENMTETRYITINQTFPAINFTSPTPANNTMTINNSVIINTSISSAGDIVEIKYNWNGTNYTIYNDTLVLMMNFDNNTNLGEGSNNFTADASIYNNSGNCSGMGSNCNWTAGKYGNAIIFDGINDHINITNNDILNISRNITLSAWIKTSANTLNNPVIAKDWDGASAVPYRLHLSNNAGVGGMGFYDGAWHQTGNSVISDGNWHFIAGTYNGTALVWYVDGKLNTTLAYTANLPNNTKPVRIGAYTTLYFNGTIDEVRIWNRTLSASEVYEIYVSNLQRYNYSQFYLYINQSKNSTAGLDNGTYTYSASAKDSLNAENQTGIRTIRIINGYPDINYTISSSPNDSYINYTTFIVNVTSNDSDKNISMFIDLDNSLVSWWRMDDVNSSGDPQDYMGRNNGSKQGNAVQVDNGYFGKGFSFDGNGDDVDFGINNNLKPRNNSYSISIWAKGNGTLGAYTGIFQFGNENTNTNFINIARNSSGGALAFIVDNGSYAWNAYNAVFGPASLLNDNFWYHYVGVIDKSANKIYAYLNGNLITNTSIPASFDINPLQNMKIGLSYDSSGNYSFNGTIDDVMIFNRSLTAAEIIGLYSNQSLKYLSVNYTGLTDRTHTIKAYSQDELGNVNFTETRNLIVDLAITNITHNEPINNSIFGLSGISVNVSSSDIGSATLIPNYQGSLVGWWRMDDLNSSGGVVEYKGLMNGTKVANATQVLNGKFGKAMFFDENYGYIEFPYNQRFNFTRNLTFSLWIYPINRTEIDWWGSMLEERNGYDAIYFSFQNHTLDWYFNSSWYFSNPPCSSNKTISFNNWTHTAFKSNDSGRYMYINGVIDNSTPCVNGGNLTTFSISTMGYLFSGMIDDVLVFNRSLTDREILSIYNATELYTTIVNSGPLNQNIMSYSQDRAGNINYTPIYSFFYDYTRPNLTINNNLINNSVQSLSNSIYVNLSSNDYYNNVSVFIDFDNTLVSWWRMDEVNSSGDPQDYMGRNNGSKQGNAAQISNGTFGKGFSFDGNGDYIQLPLTNNLNFTGTDANFTLSVWVYSKNMEDYDGILDNSLDGGGTTVRTSFTILAGANNNTRFLAYNGSDGADCRSAINSIRPNNWYHVVVTVNSSDEAILYVNGSKSGNTCIITRPGGIKDSSVGWEIGRGFSGDTMVWNGTIDDVLIFNRTLSAAEITALYLNSSRFLDVNFTGLSNRAYNIKAYSQDSSGNINSTDTRVIYVETGSNVTKCKILGVPNSIYNLTANLVPNIPGESYKGGCINITASNITFDCSGYTIINTSYDKTVIHASNIENLTIKNCNISIGASINSIGIYLSGVNYSTIENINITKAYFGIYSNSSKANNFTKIYLDYNVFGFYGTLRFMNNKIMNSTFNYNANGSGIALLNITSLNTFENILANNNTYGIYLDTDVQNNTFINISASNNSDTGFYFIATCVNNTFINTTADSNLNYGYYADSSFYNNTFVNPAAKNSRYGFYFNQATNSTLKNPTLSNISIYSVYLSSTNNFTINNGNIQNSNTSIYLTSSSANYFYNITINNSLFSGFNLTSSDMNLIKDCLIINSSHGISLYNGVDNNNVSYNRITSSSGYGLFISTTSTNNTINNNNFTNNNNSIYISNSAGNALVNNLILNSTNFGVYIDSSTSTATLTGNNATGNKYNYRFDLSAANYNRSVDYTNIIEGNKRIYYNVSIYNFEYNPTSSPNAGMIICPYCSRINVSGMNLSSYAYTGVFFLKSNNTNITNSSFYNNYNGIEFEITSNSSIQNSTFKYNQNGIFINSSSFSNKLNNLLLANNNLNGIILSYYANYTNLTNITSNNNNQSGFIFILSSNVSAWNLTANNNNGSGVHINLSNYFLMSNSSFNNNLYGISLFSSNNASISNISIINNNISGVLLYFSNATNFTNLYLLNNTEGVYMLASNYNYFYNLNITNGSYGVHIQSYGGSASMYNNLSYIYISNYKNGYYINGTFVYNNTIGKGYVNGSDFNIIISDAYRNSFVDIVFGNASIFDINLTRDVSTRSCTSNASLSYSLNCTDLTDSNACNYFNSNGCAYTGCHDSYGSDYNGPCSFIPANSSLCFSGVNGCIASYAACSGEITVCDEILTSGSCALYTSDGCSWSSSCSGALSYGNVNCNLISTYGSCSSEAVPCSGSGSCSGTFSCGGVINENYCTDVLLDGKGCNWTGDYSCDGTLIGSNACSKLNSSLTTCSDSTSGRCIPNWTSVVVPNFFINSSYRLTSESVSPFMHLIRKWYYKAYVNDTAGTAVSNANITAYNKTFGIDFSILTSSTGYTNITSITEYANLEGTRTYYSNYSLNASNITHKTFHIYNVTINMNNLSDFFTLSTSPPNITSIIAINYTNVTGGVVPRGTNVTFNATVVGITNGTGNVWVKIWQGAVGSAIVIWQGFLNWISGNLWSVTVQTNWSWPLGQVNYTIYANDTSGNIASNNSNFSIVENVNVNECRTLDSANTVYNLTANIIDNTISNDCMIISAQNITLNCRGYYISSTKNYSGVYSNQTNTTIKNCNITMGQGNNTESIGIELTDAADNSNIINNTMIGGGMYYGISSGAEDCLIANNSANISCVNCIGIYLVGSNNNTLNNNTGTSNSSYGIYLLTSSNNTLTSNTGISSVLSGIFLSSANNNILNNNNATGLSSSTSRGFYLLSSSNNILNNNTGTSNSSLGIYLVSSNNNILTSNTGTSNSSSGIYLISSNNNTLTSNTGTSNSSSGIYLVSSNNNTLINTRAEGYMAGSYGLILRNADYNNITDCINVSGIDYDVYLYNLTTSPSTDNIFLNCSYRTTGTYESVLAGNSLIRKWYYQAYVNYSNGTLVNQANVSAYNSSSQIQFSALTNSSGWINRTELIDYVNLGGTRYYYSNYIINASKSEYGSANKTLNITLVNNTLNDVLTLTDKIAPTLTIQNPGNNSNFNTTTVRFNVSGNEALSWCGLSIDSGANATMTSFNTTWFNYTNSTMTVGKHNFSFSCNDTANNYAATSIYYLLVDTTFPNVNFTNPTPGNATTQKNTDIYVNLTTNDTNDYYSFVDFDRDVLLWMRMDDVSGTTVIDYMQRNNGTSSGGAAQVDNGYFGKGFSFDGVDDYVRIQDSNILGNMSSLTISLWAKFYDNSSNQWLVYKRHTASPWLSYRMGYYSKLIQFWITNSSSSSATAVAETNILTNTWYHIVETYNGSNVQIYINGAEDDSTANILSGPVFDSNTFLDIGGFWDSLDFNGTIDEVLFFNRSLSAAEISALYNSSANKYYNNFTGLSAGQHNFTGYAVDKTGNKNQTETRQVTIDITAPAINFTSPTPSNATITSNTSIIINVSITNASDLNEVKYNWNGTNYTMYNDSLVLMMNMDNISSLGENGTSNFTADASKYSNNGNCTGMGAGCNWT
ncbi:MAG: LamG-like jellyroll fold domain-containing protein, partial [Nanoarchaeota archaeon]|nr:LamG-like jellyroll fold domain-containing protein [Nanoarchaeota archaeon]